MKGERAGVRKAGKKDRVEGWREEIWRLLQLCMLVTPTDTLCQASVL